MKLTIRVQKNTKMIDELSAELLKEGKAKMMQTKVWKAVMKSKSRGLYFLLRRKIGKYIEDEGDDWFIAYDTGTEEYINNEKKRLEKFIYGSENQLKNEKEYKEFKSDRVLQRMFGFFKKRMVQSKEAAVKKLLGEGRVLDFFTRCGITISWRIADEKEEKLPRAS